MLSRYLITSEKFAGEVEVYYSDSLLQRIDFANCNMNAAQRVAFKKELPTVEADLKGFSETFKVRVMAADVEVHFEEFWNAYGNKINRKRCIPLWEKMTATERYLAWNSCKAYNAYVLRRNKYRYDPENYLRDKMWENEWRKL